MPIKSFALLYFLFVFAIPVNGEPQSQSKRILTPESCSFSHILDMASGGDLFVAVGKNGLVMISSDGGTWTTTRWKEIDELTAITWGADRFIAVGKAGVILTSPDGSIWQEFSSSLLRDWVPTRIRFVDGNFYVVGRQYRDQGIANALFQSVDGIHWASVENAPVNVADIAGGEGQRLIITRNGMVYRSVNHGEWQPTTLKQMGEKHRGGENSRIIWNGKEYLAMQDLSSSTLFASSADGISWKAKEFSDSYGNLTWNDHAFIAVSGVGIASSIQGDKWTFTDIRIERRGLGPMNAITGAKGKTLMNSYSDYAQGPVYLISEDGKPWLGLQQTAHLPAVGQSVTFHFGPTESRNMSEEEALAATKRQRASTNLLIGFALSGISPLLYVLLQIMALRKTTGLWRVFAWLPGIIAIPLLVMTLTGLWLGSNLWPLGLIFILPMVLIYLLAFALIHWLYQKIILSKTR